MSNKKFAESSAVEPQAFSCLSVSVVKGSLGQFHNFLDTH
jgi:hypothetical protein